ncbi:hypothetical protein G5B38_09875 [Pseudohalocynthiibacter aestuariivivens]|uniref:hypothetical protein n=1 Tax=Roseovarius pelagicus TaxID=2980108 RepID=UPI0013E1A999|nr:hypothetical protein [Roseovarius pelagicus]QIE45808.1 hypothetical protein G5B38_09875 [Pseudohalocynthiibacter aestuariivivens]
MPKVIQRFNEPVRCASVMAPARTEIASLLHEASVMEGFSLEWVFDRFDAVQSSQ